MHSYRPRNFKCRQEDQGRIKIRRVFATSPMAAMEDGARPSADIMVSRQTSVGIDRK